MSNKLTAVITEAAKFLAPPGSSCKLPGRKIVAVGQGDGSGGAEDVEASSCVVEGSCAVAVASIDEARRRNIQITGDKQKSRQSINTLCSPIKNAARGEQLWTFLCLRVCSGSQLDSFIAWEIFLSWP